MSGAERSDLERIAKDLQRDLTGIKARLSELQRALAALPATDEGGEGVVCPRCGLTFKSSQRLEEHLVNVHAVGLAEAVPPPQLEVDETAQSVTGSAQSDSADPVLPF